MLVPSSTERSLTIFSITAGTVPENGPRTTVSQALALVKRAHEAGRGAWIRTQAEAELDVDAAPAPRQPGRRLGGIRIVEIAHVEGSDEWTMLLQAIDDDAASPAFLNFENTRARLVHPNEGEGNGFSAHLMIGPEVRPGAYRAVLERMPSLNRGAVFTFLNRLVRLEAKRAPADWTFVNDDQVPHRYRPKLDSHLHPGRRLRRDLEAGRMTHIELVGTEVEDDQLDEVDEVTVERKSIRLKVVADNTGNPATQLVQRLLDWGRGRGYDRMKVDIKRDGQIRSARFAAEAAVAAEVVYTQIETIGGFDEALVQCWDTIHPQTAVKMTAVLGRADLWA